MVKEELLVLLLNIPIVLISFYLLFIYIKSKTFRQYPCYNNILLSLVILIDNTLRLIHNPSNQFICFSQTFLLLLFDKLLLTTITINSFLTYLGVLKRKFYISHEKLIFYLSLCFNIGISFLISILFFVQGQVKTTIHGYCYISEIRSSKEIIDIIFIFILFCFNIYFILQLLLFVSRKLNRASITENNENIYQFHYTSILFMFLINEFLFLLVILIIKKKLFVEEKYYDLFYSLTCLGLDIFYTFNKTICHESYKIFCKKLYLQDNDSILIDTDDNSSRASSLTT